MKFAVGEWVFLHKTPTRAVVVECLPVGGPYNNKEPMYTVRWLANGAMQHYTVYECEISSAETTGKPPMLLPERPRL